MGYGIKSNYYYSIYGTKEEAFIKRHEEGFCLKIGNIETVYNSPTDNISIWLYDRVFRMQIEKLFLIAGHQLMFMKDYYDYINNLKFYRYDDKSSRGSELYAIYFDIPVEYVKDKSYRVIPYSPRYAINKEGRIVDLLHNKYFTPFNKEGRKKEYYITVALKNGRTSRSYVLHRLLASVWVANQEPYSKFFVDHINGDKMDNSIANLRWVSLQENNRYAPMQGLRTDNIPCVVKNLKTGEIKEFASTAAASEYMGGSRFTIHPNDRLKLMKARVIKTVNGIYQVKSITDPNPWITLNEWLGMSYSYDRYILRILNGKTVLEKYSSTASMSKALGLDYIEPDIKKLKDMFVKKYPNYNVMVSLERVSRFPKGFLALNEETGKIVYGYHITKLADILCVKPASATKSALHQGSYAYNGWKFKVDDGKPFKETPVIPNHPIEFKVTNTKTNETKVFSSLRQAASYLNKDKKTVMKYTRRNLLIDNIYRVETREKFN